METEEHIEEQNPQYEEQDENTVLVKKVTASYEPKSNFLNNPTEVEIKGLTFNNFNKETLICEINGEEKLVTLSNKNFNTLVDKFGSQLKGWKGKKVVIRGHPFEGNIKGDDVRGVMLTIE